MGEEKPGKDKRSPASEGESGRGVGRLQWGKCAEYMFVRSGRLIHSIFSKSDKLKFSLPLSGIFNQIFDTTVRVPDTTN